MSNGDPPVQPADRGTGPALRGVDPATDRAVERAIVPTGPPGVRIAGAGSGVVPPLAADQRAFQAALRQREQVLGELSTVLRNDAPTALAGNPHVVRAQAVISAREAQFREIASRSGTELLPADRTRALQLLDEAYELGDPNWGRARESMWRGVYQSPAGGQIIRREIAAGRMRLSESGMARGLAPEFLYEPPGGARRWVTVDIDHMIPRDRVSFYTFQPRNFHLQVDQFDRQWLNRFGAATPFPMGRYGSPDALEEFVQRFSLSRRQRPPSERAARRRRGTQAATAILTLLVVIGAGERARSAAEAMDAVRAADLRRRDSRQSRRGLPRDGIELWNLRSHVERAFDVAPVDIDSNALSQLQRATEHWLRVDYVEGGGDWDRSFTQNFDTASTAHDQDAFNRLLDELGGMLLSGVRGRLDELADIEQLLLGFQTREPQYLQGAEQAEAVAAARAEFGEEEAQVFAMSIEDLGTLVEQAAGIARRLRLYVRILHELLAAVRRAHEGDLRRRLRVQDAIEAAAGVHDAAARGSTTVPR